MRGERVPRRHTDRTRRWPAASLRLSVLLVVVATALVGVAGPAAAHNVLISSDPAEGAALATAPTMVTLTFDQPVQNFEPVVTVLGPDGQRYESGAPVVDSTVVTAGVNALPGPGAYSLAYRVVSADGHPVQGEIHFTVAGTPSATGGAAPSPMAPGASAANPAGTGTSWWPWVAGVLVLLLVGAAVLVAIRRRRDSTVPR